MKILWNKCHGIIDFLSWRRELKNAREDLVNTWAYRWLYSLWKNNKFSINSNLNLVKYIGQDEGSNVKTRQKWKEIKVKPLPNKTINIDKEYEKYDFWMSKNVYRNKMIRLVEIYLITVYLYLKRLLKP
jgi:hypothetical protein